MAFSIDTIIKKIINEDMNLSTKVPTNINYPCSICEKSVINLSIL